MNKFSIYSILFINAEDNNNLENNFLLDIDFFNTSLYVTIYLRIITNFILKDTFL